MAITRESIAQHLTGLESRLQRGLHHLFAELLAKVDRLEAEIEGLKQSAAPTAEPLPPPLPTSPVTANDAVVPAPPASNPVPVASPVVEAPSDSPAGEPETAAPVDETSTG